jgi:DNA-binding LacI/PurR family transcriptional regulator
LIAGIDRLGRYRQAIEASGRRVEPGWVAEGDFSEAGGVRAMTALLEQAPDLDAVFVAADPMAAGALRALRAAGRRVPDDIAVVGFDDAAVAATCDPPLTTVAQPLEDMTALMVELLLRQVEEGSEAVETRVCGTRLVRRASA